MDRSTSGEVTTLSRWAEGIVTPTVYHIKTHLLLFAVTSNQYGIQGVMPPVGSNPTQVCFYMVRVTYAAGAWFKPPGKSLESLLLYRLVGGTILKIIQRLSGYLATGRRGYPKGTGMSAVKLGNE